MNQGHFYEYHALNYMTLIVDHWLFSSVVYPQILEISFKHKLFLMNQYIFDVNMQVWFSYFLLRRLYLCIFKCKIGLEGKKLSWWWSIG